MSTSSEKEILQKLRDFLLCKVDVPVALSGRRNRSLRGPINPAKLKLALDAPDVTDFKVTYGSACWFAYLSV